MLIRQNTIHHFLNQGASMSPSICGSLLAILMGLFLVASVRSQEIGFVEEYVLSPSRDQALKSLIPGSEDYYYFHCLHHLSLQQYDQVAELLKPWISRHRRTPLVREIEHRLALLTYEQHPEESLQYLIRELNLRFDHQQQQRGAKPQLPTALDPALISAEQLQRRALAIHTNSTDGFEDRALADLAETNLAPEVRRHLLSRLRHPDVRNLPEIVAEDLKFKQSGGFGSLAVHNLMLQEQLDQLRVLRPELLNNDNYVNVYLRRLQPSTDLDWRRIPEQEKQHLDQLWAFVSQLAPSQNSLKAHVLYRLLQWDLKQGRYDRDRFLEYLKLPRQAGYVNPRYIERRDLRGYLCNLNQDYSQQTLMAAVGNDEPLVREYLQHFFVEDASYQPYTEYLLDTYLKQLFAETKLVNGLGDPQSWYALLTPEQLRQLQDRVDLDFAATNPETFDVDQPVQLEVFLKNTPSLIVKVFEVNTANYYRTEFREVSTDVNLDGLVANLEKTHTYDLPPIRRMKRRFEFPSLNRRGVFVIDFIGNGKSSRAVIRKGRLWFTQRPTAAGQAFRVYDEANALVKDATIWMAQTTYAADQDGVILLPYSTRPSGQPIILSAGEFSSLGQFNHQAERYELTAGFYVDRESILSQDVVQLLVRPGLMVNERRSSVKSLEDVRLQVTSRDMDGVESTQTVAPFELYDEQESVHAFRVPPRLASLSFTLTAKVQSFSENKKIDLAAGDSIEMNGIDREASTSDLHFTRSGSAYFLELLGKAGEPMAEIPLQLSIKHRDYRDPVNVALKTDAVGRIALGELTGIESLTTATPDNHAQTFAPWRRKTPNCPRAQAGKARR